MGNLVNFRKVSAALDGPLVLHFTVRMASGRQVDALADAPAIVEISGRAVTVNREGDSLVFKVPDIMSPEEAREWMSRIWHGLQYVTVRLGIVFEANFDLQETDIADGWQTNRGQLRHPLGIESEVGRDAAVDGSRPYLVPVGATFWIFGLGTPSVVIGTRLDHFLTALVEGASQAPTPKLPTQVETALQLFASAELEQQAPRPRLLTYVMAIEALAHPAAAKHGVVVGLLRDLQAKIDETLADLSLDDDARASLKALRNELDFRNKASIRASVFLFINALSNSAGQTSEDAKSRRKRFDSIYDVRGALSHTGKAEEPELRAAVRAARELCVELLSDILEFGMPSDDAASEPR
jgi:hypothetical protein